MTGPRLSRRGLIGAGAVGGVAAAGLATGVALTRSEPAEDPTVGARGRTYSPHGVHQAGIDTPAPAVSRLIALNLVAPVSSERLARLMRVWSGNIDALMAGRGALGDPVPEMSQAGVSLTATVGFGPGVFAIPGLEGKAPDGFIEIPSMKHDALRADWSGGDLLLVLAADDETSVAYAARVLLRDAAPFATPHWQQTCFWRGVDPSGNPVTGRNLFGQMDGTGNPSGDDLTDTVWDTGESQAWMAGGTSMVVRRIRFDLDVWDTLTRERQEKVIGRRLATGAPLTGVAEHDELDLTATDATGTLVIPADAHARLSHHSLNSGRRILRRGLNYTEPVGVAVESGLVFIAFQRSIADQFVPLQRMLDQADALNEWTTAIGSAVFALPGGFPPDGWLAQSLFA